MELISCFFLENRIKNLDFHVVLNCQILYIFYMENPMCDEVYKKKQTKLND